jgi:hypothetical protein
MAREKACARSICLNAICCHFLKLWLVSFGPCLLATNSAQDPELGEHGAFQNLPTVHPNRASCALRESNGSFHGIRILCSAQLCPVPHSSPVNHRNGESAMTFSHRRNGFPLSSPATTPLLQIADVGRRALNWTKCSAQPHVILSTTLHQHLFVKLG